MITNELLKEELRKVEEIECYDLARKLNVHVDDVLTYIQDNILPEFSKIFNKNAFKIPFYSSEQLEDFFKNEIIDLGFLCQHKIVEIKKNLENKHNSFAHQIFYNNWVMHRGY